MTTTETPKSTGAIMSDIMGHVGTLVRNEADLACAEIKKSLGKFVASLGIMALAVALGIAGLNLVATSLVACRSGHLGRSADRVGRFHPARQDLSLRSQPYSRTGGAHTRLRDAWHLHLYPRAVSEIEGFGFHTFRFVTDDGRSTFVKFFWKPRMGLQSVLWDKAMKTNGADPNAQLKRLGGSSFTKLAIDAPKGCPISNGQQDTATCRPTPARVA